MSFEKILLRSAERAWLLPATMHKLMKGFSDSDPETDLNKTQARILAVMSSHREMTASTLHRITTLEKGSLTPILRTLETKGLIRRETDPQDRRRQKLILTETGTLKNRELRSRAAAHIRKRLEMLDKELISDLDRALDTLSRIAALLEGEKEYHEK